jgi:broad specificity phosphatase PhoE
VHTNKYKLFPSLFRTGPRSGQVIFSLFSILPLLLTNPLFAEDGPTTVFLVRHAEKMLEGDDPLLSDAGRQRSEQLATLLADAGISRIFSTDFARTRQTAAPLAAAEGLEIELYDPADPGQVIESIQDSPGRYLLVGHSNTVPNMVARFGGEPHGAIEEAGEYDRLYVVTVGAGSEATTVLLRYGERFEP